jgi:hypothetical protein
VTSRKTPSPVVTPFFGRIDAGSHRGRLSQLGRWKPDQSHFDATHPGIIWAVRGVAPMRPIQ